MAERIYQLIEQNRFELRFVTTTFEEATDITYTSAQIKEMFNGGEYISIAEYNKFDDLKLLVSLTNEGYTWDNEARETVPNDVGLTYVYYKELVQFVLAALEKGEKQVGVAVSPLVAGRLKWLNKSLKVHGIQWRGEYFSRYNVKKTESKRVSEVVLRKIKIQAASYVRAVLNSKYNVPVTFEDRRDDADLIKIFQFAESIGVLSFDEMLAHTHFGCYNHPTDATYTKTFDQFVTGILSKDKNEDMLDRTKAAFIDWYKIHVPVYKGK